MLKETFINKDIELMLSVLKKVCPINKSIFKKSIFYLKMKFRF